MDFLIKNFQKQLNIVAIFCLCLIGLFFSSLGHAKENKPYSSDVTHGSCLLYSELDHTKLGDYCNFFNLRFQTDGSWKYCYKNEQAVCRFPRKEYSLLKNHSPELDLDFYQNKENLIDWVASQYIQPHNNSLETLISMLFSLTLSTHPFNEFFENTLSDKTLSNYLYINKMNGVSLSAENLDYYNFINNTQPFKEVSSHLPEIFYKPFFWKAYEASYKNYTKILQETKDDNLKQLDSVLGYLHYLLSQHFGEQAFLFYPIKSKLPSTFNGVLNLRLVLYYEQEIAGSMWGKSIILPFDGNSSNPLIISGNYDLEGSPQQSFFYEEYFSNKSPNRKISGPDNRFSDESCMQCHLQMNKTRTGPMSNLLSEDSRFFADYSDGFYLNNSYTYDGNKSPKASQFMANGKNFHFPKYLQAKNSRKRLYLYQVSDLGPILGDPISSPHASKCFEKPVKSWGMAANCYTCHDDSEQRLGPIHTTNFKMSMKLLKKQLTYSPKTNVEKKVYAETFMPYRMFLNDPNDPYKLRPQAQTDLKNLISCLEENFNKDQLQWLQEKLFSALNEM